MLLHYLAEEVKNIENVILQREITKQNCIEYITVSSKWIRVIVCPLNLLIWSVIFVIQKCLYETIHDVDNL